MRERGGRREKERERGREREKERRKESDGGDVKERRMSRETHVPDPRTMGCES